MEKKKVLVGMSGGVDSSAAAAVLLEEGYDVYGATMRLLPEESTDYTAETDAAKVCGILGIKHYILDFRDEFKKSVIDYFVNEYINGRTPNPCIACNKHLKFGLMLEKALEMGMDYIATGHYAGIESENGKYYLKTSDYKEKDQSYVLYNLTQEQMEHVLMPLEKYTKEQLREKCRELKLPVADKAESMDICFIRDGNYQRFIADYSKIIPSPGDICDIFGNVIGKHKGLVNYTIGQRKGIGAYGKPMFVLSMDMNSNTLVLGEKGMEFSKALIAEDVNYISGEIPKSEITASAKVRYKSEAMPCRIIPNGKKAKVIFDEPQRAVTPGQSVVFYDGNKVIGGGVVSKPITII